MSKSKNSCGGCCCNDCESKLPEALRCCCNCVCQTICVTVSIPGDPDCGCNQDTTQFTFDCVTDSWHGFVTCDNLVIDLDFSVKTCNDKCYVCLKSTCLGMEYGTCPTDCIEFTPGRAFCRGTYSNNSRTGGISATWTGIDFSNCGDVYCGTGTISISCVERVARTCENCNASVSCEGCDCHCRCVCITHQLNEVPGGDDCDGILKVCYDDSTNSFHGTIECVIEDDEPGDPYNIFVDVDISIVADAYGNCVFKLVTNIGDVLPTDNLEEQLANPVVSVGCPDFVVSWRIDHIDGSKSVITATCLGCGGTCTRQEITCCPGIIIPATLTATIKTDESPPVTQGTGTITFNENSEDNCWEGTIDIICPDDDPPDFQCAEGSYAIKMCCGTGDTAFTVGVSCPPNQGELQGQEALTCEPFFARFGTIGTCKPNTCCSDWFVEVSE